MKFEIDGKEFIAIDTAGIRKKKQIQGSIEFLWHGQSGEIYPSRRCCDIAD